MSAMTTKTATTMKPLLRRLLCLGTATAALLLAAAAQAAAPGIKGASGATFGLIAKPDYITQPDGQSVYSWGYACSGGSGVSAAPSAITAPLTKFDSPAAVIFTNSVLAKLQEKRLRNVLT